MTSESNVIVRKMLHCEKCGEIFSTRFERCPKCKSRRFVGYTVVNPVARLPMEAILQVMGHLSWLLGTVVCLVLLWHTDSADFGQNMTFLFAGFGALLFCLFLSIALFGMGEMLQRTIRIQHRLRAMFDVYQNQSE